MKKQSNELGDNLRELGNLIFNKLVKDLRIDKTVDWLDKFLRKYFKMSS